MWFIVIEIDDDDDDDDDDYDDYVYYKFGNERLESVVKYIFIH